LVLVFAEFQGTIKRGGNWANLESQKIILKETAILHPITCSMICGKGGETKTKRLTPPPISSSKENIAVHEGQTSGRISKRTRGTEGRRKVF